MVVDPAPIEPPVIQKLNINFKLNEIVLGRFFSFFMIGCLIRIILKNMTNWVIFDIIGKN